MFLLFLGFCHHQATFKNILSLRFEVLKILFHRV